MQIGRLDRRIVIEASTPVADDVGEMVDSWSTLATVWARVQQKSGREFFAADRTVSEVDTLFTIRWRSDVTVKHRITYGGSTYDIVSVREIARQAGLEIMAKVIV